MCSEHEKWDVVTCVPDDIGGRETQRINTREQTFAIFLYLAHRPPHILRMAAMSKYFLRLLQTCLTQTEIFIIAEQHMLSG
jgi:hypothetical protein